MEKNSKIYVAGHTGMVGSAIVRKLKEEGYTNIVGRTIEELDLINQQAVIDFFSQEKPEYVFLAAAKVGGIQANNIYRAQFIYENLMIQNNIIHQSYKNRVKKLLFLGSSCIYPKNSPQPMREEYLLTGELEQTNEPYAIAKISGIKMCENYYRQYGCNFLSVMPTNLFGPYDNYNLETSHVLPALIRKMHLGKCLENNNWEAIRCDLNKRPIEGIKGDEPEVEILHILGKYGLSRSLPPFQVKINLWGSGQVYREFLYVDDMAASCIQVMIDVNISDLVSKYNPQTTYLNIGTASDLKISDLTELIREVVGYSGLIEWDRSKPDGTLKKLLSLEKLKSFGIENKRDLSDGIMESYNHYLTN